MGEGGGGIYWNILIYWSIYKGQRPIYWNILEHKQPPKYWNNICHLFPHPYYLVSRIIRVAPAHYLLLELCAKEMKVDEFGAFYIDRELSSSESEMRLVSLFNSDTVTALWTIAHEACLYLVPKY